jgi:formylglycine-generating enzyme required for sulfatase activity
VRATGRAAGECLIYVDKAWRSLPGSSWQYPPFPQADDHPVICVNWDDAAAYAAWLSQRTGHRYRLLSESEWEYAARAGTVTARYWGDGTEQACEWANVADRDSPRPQFTCDDGHRHTAPARFGRPNAFGLYGMLGNVGEWVADCGLPDYASAPRDGAAVTTGDCGTHAGRGGSWWNDAYYIRAARRFNMAGGYYIVGFRVAREMDAAGR